MEITSLVNEASKNTSIVSTATESIDEMARWEKLIDKAIGGVKEMGKIIDKVKNPQYQNQQNPQYQNQQNTQSPTGQIPAAQNHAHEPAVCDKILGKLYNSLEQAVNMGMGDITVKKALEMKGVNLDTGTIKQLYEFLKNLE